MKELNNLLGIRTKLSIAYHPQTDNQTKRTNQELEQYLRMFVDYRQEQWLEWLGIVEFAFNNKIHNATQTSPFRANYGQDLRIGFEGRRRGNFEAVEKFMERMGKAQEEVKAVMRKAQEEIRKYTDRRQMS